VISVAIGTLPIYLYTKGRKRVSDCAAAGSICPFCRLGVFT
jgi:hypothetical protein